MTGHGRSEFGRRGQPGRRSVAALKESELRAQLAGMGFPGNDIEDQIERGRNLHRLSGEVACECTTTLGGVVVS